MKQLLSRWLMRPWQAALGVMVAVLVACGGGGGVGEGGTGSFVSGPISGFGSVIVGGVRFDDSSPTTTIEDEEGDKLDRSALSLGMVVEVEGGPIDASGGTLTATARSIRIGSAIVGPVTEVFPLMGVVRVLGQPVRVTAATVFGSGLEGRLAALAADQVVEVNGFFGIDPDTRLPRFVATRIDKVSLSLPSDYTYKVRGIARNVDAQTFSIGDQVFDYGNIAGALSRLPEANRFVRARVQTVPDAQGRWIVTQLDVGLPALADVREAKLEGIVTDVTSSVVFNVNGNPVDASNVSAAIEVALGDRVEVEGRVSQGVLQAVKVEIKTEEEVDNEPYDLHGTVDSVDRAARTFVLTTEDGFRTYTIAYDGSTQFEGNGTAADLMAGARIEAKVLLATATGQLLAREIQFE